MWGPEYEIQLELMVKSWLGMKWGSIVRFTADPEEGNCCQVGQSIPSLWTKKKTNDELQLATNINGNGNTRYDSQMGKFQPGVWYSFVISQKKKWVIF